MSCFLVTAVLLCGTSTAVWESLMVKGKHASCSSQTASCQRLCFLSLDFNTDKLQRVCLCHPEFSMEAKNGRARNSFFLIPLSSENEIINPSSQQNKNWFPLINKPTCFSSLATTKRIAALIYCSGPQV